MPIVTPSALAAELKRLETFIEYIPLDRPRERQSSRDKAVAVIYALNRLGLIDTDVAHSLHHSVERTGKGA
jgi:hypothetical protein